METMDTIFSRRSIRKYLPKPVSSDLIENVLKAGMNAPSAASENMLLAAHDLGLGAVWIGVYPAENLVREVRNILNINPS